MEFNLFRFIFSKRINYGLRFKGLKKNVQADLILSISKTLQFGEIIGEWKTRGIKMI